MTDAQKMLALASSAMPSKQWAVAPSGKVFSGIGAPGPLDWFDPANNSDQAIAVWCWLIAQWGTTDAGGVIEVRVLKNSEAYGYTYETPAEWRQAVTDAALMVARVKL